MSACVLSLNGEPLQVDGLEDVGTVAEVRVHTAAALGCSVSSIKLVLGHASKGASDCLLKDEQKLEELSCKTFIAIKQSLDPSLVKLTSEEKSEYDEGQTDFYKTSILSYDGTVIWNMSNHKACHIGGWGGSTHVAELSADKMVLVVTSGGVRQQSGDMYQFHGDRFAPKKETLNVEELVTSKGLI
mmetsp:Transcript_106307/g.195167  ORF Transcript_106307/g.195167 Transcript_106307/m.195167 type:complete len:186 (-) Transcript_106307:257-814(-)